MKDKNKLKEFIEKELNRKILEEAAKITKARWHKDIRYAKFLVIYFVVFALGIASFAFTSKYTGLFTLTEENSTQNMSYTDVLNLEIGQSQEYNWTLGNFCNLENCNLKSVSISGSVIANESGNANIYIENSGRQYLIFNKSFELNKTTFTQNVTFEQNISVINETTNETIIQTVNTTQEINETVEQPETFYFDDSCIETCDLSGAFDESSYKMMFNISENTSVELNSINYQWQISEQTKQKESPKQTIKTETPAEKNATKKLTKINASGAELDLYASGNISENSIKVIKYLKNLWGANFNQIALNKYIEIEPGPEVNTTVSWAIIKIYYTKEEIASEELNESSLRINFFNETTNNWQAYDNSSEDMQGGVNMENSYVWANVTHFSVFGLFGDPLRFVKISTDGDKKCDLVGGDEICTSYINITNRKNFDILIPNSTKFNLFFDKFLKGYELWMAASTYSVSVPELGICDNVIQEQQYDEQTSSYKTADVNYPYRCPTGSHLEDRLNYSENFNPMGQTLKAGETWYLKLVGHKAANEDVKWGINAVDSSVDPVWYSNAHYENESESFFTTTSASYVNASSLTFSLSAATPFIFFATGSLNISSTSGFAYARLVIDNTECANTTIDAVGAATEVSGFGFMEQLNLTAGSHTVLLQYRSSSTSYTAGIKYPHVQATSLAGDIWYYNESEYQNTTTGGTMREKLRLAFTPPSGNYSVFGYWEMTETGNTNCVIVNFSNSINYQYSRYCPSTANNSVSDLNVHQDALTSSVTARIQFNDSSTTTAKIMRARIFAIRMTGNETQREFWASKDSSTSATGSWVNITTLTFTPSLTGNYTIMASDVTASSATGTAPQTKLMIDNVQYSNSIQYQKGTTNDRVPHTHTEFISLTGGTPHNIMLQLKNGTGSGTSYAYYGNIIVWKLDEASNPPLWRNQTTNDTDNIIAVGGAINLSAQGYDENGLDYAILSTNETGGVWMNKTTYNSPMNLSGAMNTWTWSNFTWQNSSVAAGTAVGWTIYYNDTTGKQNVTNISAFTVQSGGITLPQYNSNFTSISNGTQYASGRNYGFQINWTDDSGINKVFFETNLNSTLANYTIGCSGASTNVLCVINFTDLSAGSYQYRWIANDTSNNFNTTGAIPYTIAKNTSAVMRLFLNGTEGNMSYVQNKIANFTAFLNVSGKTVYMNSNYTGWVQQSGTNSVIYNITTLSTTGNFWNLTAFWNGDTNYTASSQTYFFNVTSPSITISLTNSPINFGNIILGQTNDTTDDSPLPFVIQNDGDVSVNVTIEATNLWSTATNPTSKYQFMCGATGEASCASGSVTTFTNMPASGNPTKVIAFLNYVDSSDTNQVDINITSPAEESPGSKSSTVTFIASQS